MNNRTISLLLMLLFHISAQAQPNFKNAYLITQQGDTLHGYIDYKEWTRTPARFLYKTSLNEKEVTTYTVDNTRKLVFEGRESYERFVVSVSMNEVDYNLLDMVTETPADVPDTVFLKLLAGGGRLNLYSYTDKLKERFYVQAPPQTTPEELRYSVQREINKLSAAYTYRQQLAQIASLYPADAVQVNGLIAAAPYSAGALEEIANRLNGIDEAALNATRKKFKLGRLFASAGINYSTATYKGENLITANGWDGNEKPTYTSKTMRSVLPVVSVGYDLFFRPSAGRSYLRMEMAATAIRSHINAFYKFPRPYDEELTIRYRLSGIFIAFNPQLGYTLYQGPKLHLHAGIGPSLRYSVYPTQTLQQNTNKEGPGYKDVTVEDPLRLKRVSVTPTVHAGAFINKKTCISINWFKTMGMISKEEALGNLSVKTGSLHLNVAYLF